MLLSDISIVFFEAETLNSSIDKKKVRKELIFGKLVIETIIVRIFACQVLRNATLWWLRMMAISGEWNYAVDTWIARVWGSHHRRRESTRDHSRRQRRCEDALIKVSHSRYSCTHSVICRMRQGKPQHLNTNQRLLLGEACVGSEISDIPGTSLVDDFIVAKAVISGLLLSPV